MSILAKTKSWRLVTVSILPMGLDACSEGSQQASSKLAPAPSHTFSARIVRADFSPTNTEFANPERGFYQAASTDFDVLSAAELANAYAADPAGYRQPPQERQSMRHSSGK